MKLKLATVFLFLSTCSALAQGEGAVVNHAIPVGRGPGVTGFGSLIPGASGSALVSNGTGADPSWQSLSGLLPPLPTNQIYVGNAGGSAAPVPMSGDCVIVASGAIACSGKANIASPTFTGDPKAPTATAGDNDTSIATTAFVTGAIGTAVSTLNLPMNSIFVGSAGNVATAVPMSGDCSLVSSGLITCATKANVASPTFTGDPKAPTPTAGDSDTSLATTAFVSGALATLDPITLKASEVSITSAATLTSSHCGKTVYASTGDFTITVGANTIYTPNCVIKIHNQDNSAAKMLLVVGLNDAGQDKLQQALYPGQSVILESNSQNWQATPRRQRWIPDANLAVNFYVAIGGNDALDCFTLATACNSVQGAYNKIKTDLDHRALIAQINVGAGTFTTTFQGTYVEVGAAQVRVQGDSNTTTILTCGATQTCVFLREPITMTWANLKVITTGGGSTAFSASQFATLDLDNVSFGDFPGGTHVQATDMASVNFLGDYTYASAGGSTGTHITASFGSYIHYGGRITGGSLVATISGSPTVSYWVSLIHGARLDSGGIPATFSGAPTAGTQKYALSYGASMLLGGATFPGTVAGTADAGTYASVQP